MTKYLGLDLGTNSIGWAIRDSNTEKSDNQIIDYGVVIFKKGVGEGKSGEYSLAAERRKNRSKRRLYNAKRYRKWATLKILSENGMCPISIEELRLWSIGKWQEIEGKKKNTGRFYPTSPDFIAWLAMDFKKIGTEWGGEKLNPAFENPYELRIHLLNPNEDYENDPYRLYKIGRAFYHLVQRRGFKSSRKSGKSAYGVNTYLEEKLKENPDWKASQILQHGLTLEKRRIRNSGVIQRRYFEEEFSLICDKQKLTGTQKEAIYKAIYFVRPLRTQKGLVGKCTLETGKFRIPVSHPLYEEFRALQYINNIQWRETGSKKRFETIPMLLKKTILEQIFFKPIERGPRKGKVNDRSYFEFKEIVDKFSENYKYEFNYARYKKNSQELITNPNVSTCPVIAGLMNVFAESWTEKFIIEEDKYGINWANLILRYEIKYQNITKPKSLDYIAIWHMLFDYIQIKDNEKDLNTFCMNILHWNNEKTSEFNNISISQGYGSLSYNAISKIIPFLREESIYSEAVSFANLKSVLGDEKYEKKKDEAHQLIRSLIKEVDLQKEKLNITNGLIQNFFGENNSYKAKGVNGTEEEINTYRNEVITKLKNYFGEENWGGKTDDEKSQYEDFVFDKYLRFLDGKQDKEEKASSIHNKNPEIDYYKLPRLDEAIKQLLKNKFAANDDGLKKLYHPSDIDIYSKSKTGFLEDPNPPSKGWKNPMAMRTMYELRNLINFLLKQKKIDEDTKIVIEMARELNDANKRWAIQTYQKKREEQNIEFAKAIIGLAKEKYPNLNENDANNIDKVRLWWEQLENGDEIYKQVKALKEDVQKYRLWKEQNCQCVYTGRIINLVDLFDGTQVDFEHTLPASVSFDNSLANKTVCDAHYNRTIKMDKIPFDCGNYEKEWENYTPIKPRLGRWIEKVEALRERIKENKIRTKKTQDPAIKTELIQKRHLLIFDFDYWDKKVKTFTVEKVPNWWKNSQLVDTQIISKYARAYMKSLFNKVDVQKGSITSEFRKIFEIMGDEKKDRSKHSHHAIDAAVLTLIPGSANRESILKEYYQALERNIEFHKSPYENFNIGHVKNIENTVLINHISKDQTLANTIKNNRKRGKIVYLKDKITQEYLKDFKGEKIPKIMQGDNVRGQLFEETFFGAIHVVEKNENNFPKKDESGNYIVEKGVDGEPLVRYVTRIPISKLIIEMIDGEIIIKNDIVDTVLKLKLEKQLNEGKTIEQLVSYENREKNVKHLIRHIRVFHSKQPIVVKPHSAAFMSIHKHKQSVYAMNGENYLYLLYEGIINEKMERDYDLINLKTFIENKELFKLPYNKLPEKGYYVRNKLKGNLPCIAKLIAGQLVILFRENKEELKEIQNEDIRKRLYRIRQLENDGRLKLDYHLEARKEEEIKLEVGDGEAEPSFENPFPKLRLRPSKFKFIIEGKDFNISPDGVINWLF